MTASIVPSQNQPPFIRRSRDWTGLAIRIAEIALIVALALTLTGSDSRRTASDQRSDRLAACRSLYNSDLQQARTDYTDAVTARDKLQTEALTALGIDEQALFSELAHRLPDAFTSEDEMNKKVNEATDTYTAMSVLAVSDPSAFLAKCDARVDSGN